MNLPNHLQNKLAERVKQNAYRQLRLPDAELIDFNSNDYLGIVKNRLLVNCNDNLLASGSTGSRLLTGNNLFIEETEHEIAAFHKAEAAILYNSGYDANLGILSSVPQKNDTILYDSLCHASIRDGIRLSFSKAFSFLHNNVADLRKKIQQATGTVFIVTESVFSMDGDVCPLADILCVCNEYNAYLILDEAHAIGVIGEKGEGLAQKLNLQEDVFCRVYTFGKACGCHGAVAVGSQALKDYLVNFSRSFIFSTALPTQAVASIRSSYKIFPVLNKERSQLDSLQKQFCEHHFSEVNVTSFTPIQAFIKPGNDEVKRLSQQLLQNGFDIRPIVYPTVAKGSERLRIILHAYNTSGQLDAIINLLQQQV